MKVSIYICTLGNKSSVYFSLTLVSIFFFFFLRKITGKGAFETLGNLLAKLYRLVNAFPRTGCSEHSGLREGSPGTTCSQSPGPGTPAGPGWAGSRGDPGGGAGRGSGKR